MGVQFRELFLLLAIGYFALTASALDKAAKIPTGDSQNNLYQLKDYDAADELEVLYNENRPCPRDCICSVFQGYRIAKCNRLEVGTQKFGDNITDLMVENSDPRSPVALTEDIFLKLNLRQVSTIKIVNSTISEINPKAFYGLDQLYAINLSNNKYKNIHPSTFVHNKKLLLLTLSNNPLKFPPPASKKYFLDAPSVQELDISFCNMKHIGHNTFKNMPGLMYLNVAGNNIATIDKGAFSTLLDLEELDLSDNNISHLSSDIFANNTELATLHIQRNPIFSVQGLMIPELLTLNAGQTNIRDIGRYMFNGMRYIANLNLSGNHISYIHENSFHQLVELNYLDLSHNDLKVLSENIIKENIELDIFKVSHNPNLKHLPKYFSCSAGQFNIYLFDASHCGLEELFDDSLKSFTALSQINLSGNKIKYISAQVFSNCSKLADLNLSHNSLTTLDPQFLEYNTELQKLDLQGNPLKVLQLDVFKHTLSLTWLDLSQGELTVLWEMPKENPENLTKALNNLSFLNVSHNHIMKIQQSDLDRMKKLRALDIRGNPLTCDHEFENLMTWINNHSVSLNIQQPIIANIEKDGKEEDRTDYSWETLTHEVCGTSIVHPVQPLLPVSDEEIWENINKDTDSVTDIKNNINEDKINDDQDVDEDEDDNDEVDSDEDYDEGNDDMDLKIKLIEKSTRKLENDDKSIKHIPEKETVKININVLENDNDGLKEEVYMQQAIDSLSQDQYDYLWPLILTVLSAILLLLVILKVIMSIGGRRNKRVKYNSAIIAAMSYPGRTKKDCGLVYQQLTEDVAGPKTPKLNRYVPVHTVTVNTSNMYESSPFHHNNIVPEAV